MVQSPLLKLCYELDLGNLLGVNLCGFYHISFERFVDHQILKEVKIFFVLQDRKHGMGWDELNESKINLLTCCSYTAFPSSYLS